VKQRVAEGFYDRPEVREAIADAVLDSDVVEGVRQEARQVGEARSEIENVPEVREDRVEQARRRVASNFYDSANARVETANRILENIVG
jgi:membrane-bound lytic murein transglycosylase B